MNEVVPTSPPAIVQVDLQTVARQLAEEHDACCNATYQALHHALRAGDLLLLAKAECRHGEWLPWLKENFKGSPRNAQLYMKLARHREIIVKNAPDAHLSIVDAVKLLRAPKQEPDSDDLLLAATTVVMPPDSDDPASLAAFGAEHDASLRALRQYLDQAAEKIDSPDATLEELGPLLKDLEKVVNAQRETTLRIERRLGQLIRDSKPGDDDLLAGWRQRADDLKVPECDGTTGYIIDGTHDTICQLWPSEKYPGAWYVHITTPNIKSPSGWALDWTGKPVIREGVPHVMDRSQFVPQGDWQAIDSPIIPVEEFDWQKELAGRGQQ